MVGGAIGTLVEPGGGTLVGAGIGRAVGAAGAFVGATAGAVAIYFATTQGRNIGKTEGQLEVALTHIDRIASLGPGDQDPDGKRRDWTKHAQKALNNALKYVDRVRGKTQDALRDQINQPTQRLRDLQ